MNRFLSMALGLLLFASFATASEKTVLEQEIDGYLAAAEGEAQDPNDLRVYWSSGIKLETANGAVKVSIGGRLMWDNLWMTSDEYTSSVTADRSFFRRIRLAVSGTVYKNTIFKVQIDFAGEETFVDSVEGVDNNGDGQFDALDVGTDRIADVALRDVYVGLKKIPVVGTFKAGHHHEPFSLEEISSSKYMTFLERSAPTNAIAGVASRSAGISFANAHFEKRFFWQIGVFRTNGSTVARDTGDGGYSLTLRVTGFAVQTDDTVVHLGFSFSLRNPSNGRVRFRARPGTGTGSRLVDSGNIAVDDFTLVGFEFAVLWRSLAVQGEFFIADTATVAGTAPGLVDPSFGGFYVEVTYWITGERTKFKGNLRGRPKPKNNFFDGKDGGAGAWQVAVRFDTVDLSDGMIAGGEQDTITFGVNWHWNPNTRIMINVVLADVTGRMAGNGSQMGNGDLTSFMIRCQFDF